MVIGVVDIGVGNHGSVFGALRQNGQTPRQITNPKEIGNSDCLILPGVGHFGTCYKILKEGGWVDELHKAVVCQKKPLLGICLGMQLLADCSEESINGSDVCPGLAFIPGKVRYFGSQGCRQRLPHIGWNSICFQEPQSSLFKNIPEGTDFYFVHSYIFEPKSFQHVIAKSFYDVSFAAAVNVENIWGTQFHPEKSSRAGFQLLRNFIENNLC